VRLSRTISVTQGCSILIILLVALLTLTGARATPVVSSQPITTTSTESMLFEYRGDIVAGLSYVHSVIPMDIPGLINRIDKYETAIRDEFQENRLHTTFLEMVAQTQKGSLVKVKAADLAFNQSAISKWREIAGNHLTQVHLLRDQLAALLEFLPPIDNELQHEVAKADTQEWNDVFTKINNPTQKRTRRRRKRNPIAIAAVAGGILLGGTIMGIYNTDQINKIWAELEVVNQKLMAFKITVDAMGAEIEELQNTMHGVLLRELLDYAFDPAVLNSRLQMQYEVLRLQVTRMSNAMQQVQHRRLAVDYLDKNTLFKIFSQAKFRAKSAACNVLVNHPSQLTQLETSYVYDGKKASIILHIPIAPEEATL